MVGTDFRENFVQHVTKTIETIFVHIFRIISLWYECCKAIIYRVR